MLSVAPSLAETWMSLSYLHIQLSLLQVEVLCCTVKFIPILKTQQVVRYRVNETGGNWSGLTGYRSNRSGPVTVWAGIIPAPIQNLNLNSKK